MADAGKKVKGRKRHLIIDSLGLLLAVYVTSASIQDRDAAFDIFKEVKQNFSSLKIAFADRGYRGKVKSLIEKETKMQVRIALRSDGKKRRKV